MGAACPGVIRGDEQNELVACHSLAQQRLVETAPSTRPSSTVPSWDGGRDLGGITHRQPQFDSRMDPAVFGQVPWQPVAGDGLAGAHGQTAALQAAELPQHELDCRGARQNGPGLVEKGASRLGQGDVPPDAVEQSRAVPALQRCDGGAGDGLRKVQRLGGAGDVLAFRDGDEYPKLLQGHAAQLSRRGGGAGSLGAVGPIRCFCLICSNSGPRQASTWSEVQAHSNDGRAARCCS